MTKSTEITDEFWQRLAESPVLMVSLPAQVTHSEPMTAALDVRSHPRTIFFFARADNRLVRGVQAGHAAGRAEFASSGHDYFASLKGRISLARDASLVARLWSNESEAWFKDGRNDPQVRLLRFDVEHMEVWKVDRSLGHRLRRFFGGAFDAQRIEDGHVRTNL